MSDPQKSIRPAPGPTAAPRPHHRDVHILDRLAILYRYRRVAAAVFALTTAAVMIQGYSHVRMFQAQARLLIEDERRTAVPGITSPENTYWEDPLPYYQTQYRILKGRDLTRRVVKKLELWQVPEFNGTAEAPPTPVARRRPDRASGPPRAAAGSHRTAPACGADRRRGWRRTSRSGPGRPPR